MAKAPSKKHGIQEDNSSGINENTRCFSDSLQRKFGSLCFGA